MPRLPNRPKTGDLFAFENAPNSGSDFDKTKTQVSGSSAPPAKRRPSRLQRADLFLRIMVRLYVGLIVVIVPWSHFWTDNHLLLYYALPAKIAMSGVFRGTISGLGILNLWIALSDALHSYEG